MKRYYTVYCLLFVLFLCLAVGSSKRGNALTTSRKSSISRPTTSHKSTSPSRKSNKSKISNKKTKGRSKRHSTGSKRRGKLVLPQGKRPLLTSILSNPLQQTQTYLQQLQDTTAQLKRQVKSYFSSDFEALLLQLTQPNDVPPSEKDVERFLATTSSFHRTLDVTALHSPYRVTMHKLWCKLIEEDNRIVLKTLWLWHLLSKQSDPEDAVLFKQVIQQLRREYCVKSKGKYFSKHFIKRMMARIERVQQQKTSKQSTNVLASVHNTQYLAYIQHYYQYLTLRTSYFTSQCEEMKCISHKMSIQNICIQLVKACKLLSFGVAFSPSIAEESELTITIWKEITSDLLALFEIYGEKVNWLRNEAEVSDIFEDADFLCSSGEVKVLLDFFTSFYRLFHPKLQQHVNGLKESMQFYRMDGDMLQVSVLSELLEGSQDDDASDGDLPGVKEVENIIRRKGNNMTQVSKED